MIEMQTQPPVEKTPASAERRGAGVAVGADDPAPAPRAMGAPVAYLQRTTCAASDAPDPLAEMLARAVRERNATAVSPAAGGLLQREVATAVPPHIHNSERRVTGVRDADAQMESARVLANEWVAAAMTVLASEPKPGSTYEIALARHFIAPTLEDRLRLIWRYGLILLSMRPEKYICESGQGKPRSQAAWSPVDKLIRVYRPFWKMSRASRAIVLIHESAHDVPVDDFVGHSPYRGYASYPKGNTPLPGVVTTPERMENPDAYAFFAAHIGRGNDDDLRF